MTRCLVWKAGWMVVPFPELQLQAACAMLRLGQPRFKCAGRNGLEKDLRGLAWVVSLRPKRTCLWTCQLQVNGCRRRSSCEGLGTAEARSRTGLMGNLLPQLKEFSISRVCVCVCVFNPSFSLSASCFTKALDLI